MRSRQKLRDRYASQRQETLRDIEFSSMVVAFQKLRNNIAAAHARAARRAESDKLLSWRRILNFRRRVLVRW